jgi:large subunit ribosomal protein L13
MTPTKKSTKFVCAEDVARRWYVVDAEGKSLGRLSTRVAWLLMGKHKPEFSPNADCGDFVVVVNAEKIRLTGKKLTDKKYRWYTGYPGGLKERSAEVMLEKQPQKVVEWSIHGMLPKTSVGKRVFNHLKVYAGGQHPHQAQNPEKIEI